MRTSDSADKYLSSLIKRKQNRTLLHWVLASSNRNRNLFKQHAPEEQRRIDRESLLRRRQRTHTPLQHKMALLYFHSNEGKRERSSRKMGDGTIALLAEGRPTFWQKQRHSYLVFTERLCLGSESPIYSIIQVLLHLFSYWPKGIQAMLAEIGAVSPYGFRDSSSKSNKLGTDVGFRGDHL